MLIVENIGGFKQGDDRWHGAKDMHEIVLAEMDDYSPLSVRVRYRCWNDNWKAIAADAKLLKNKYWREPFGIVVNCFSYGGGWGLTRYANHLKRKNLQVACAVISDGIMRPWTRLLAWQSLYGHFPIHLPDNVLTYHGYFQQVNRPGGEKPVGKAECLTWKNLHVEHTLMDDEPEWHQRCVEVAMQHAKLFVGSKAAVPVGAPDSVAVEVRAFDSVVKEAAKQVAQELEENQPPPETKAERDERLWG